MLVGFKGFAQFTDDFNDNDFTSNPTWIGDEAKFTIENQELRLLAPAVASSAYLTTGSNSINSAVWQFSLRLDFNPSSSNYARVYLVSDQSSLTNALDGYFVMVGNSSDEISLYRQSGFSITKIIDGTDGTVDLSTVEVDVKVTRDDLGNWELFSDIGLSGTFVSEGVINDNTIKSSQYFGVFCNYSSTRSDKFYFDNFNVTGNPYVDLDPPQLLQIDVLSSTRLLLHFDEQLEASSSNNTANYQEGTIGQPNSATLQPNKQSVELVFSTPFQNGETYELFVNGVADLNDNMVTTSRSFLYFQPLAVNPKDIIITEIFADPTPQIGLPDAEFIEIYNRSNSSHNVNGWTLTDGASESIIPDKIIKSGTYWIITSTSNVSKFGLNANVIGASNFPTLNNAADVLVLMSPTGITIDSLNYNQNWYNDEDKKDGGWSLELIDPANICGEEDNWTSSVNETGGTPGLVNSVLANKPDLTGPHLIAVQAQNSNKIKLVFNEKMESPISSNITFSISPNIIIDNFYFESNAFRSIILELDGALTLKQLYTITVTEAFDCSGNEIDSNHNQIDFAISESADSLDILINEILFNPRPNGVDFVEFYNNSNKYINLRDYRVGNYKDGIIENTKVISAEDRTLKPEEYVVLTSDPNILINNYPQGKLNAFIQVSLPSFPDSEGSVALINDQDHLIDYLNYNKSFHSEFIKDDEGVSLERISFTSNTIVEENWTSASSTAGFATPGYVNSNSKNKSVLAEGNVSIEPPIFSPSTLGDGFSQIKFKFDQSGFVANIKVLDHQGRLIKTIANNVTLGSDGFFRWDGDQEDGTKARAGYYLVWFEIFNASGFTKTFRKRVIIALR